MSLKAEIETWAAALKAYDEQDFEKSLDLFSTIADFSKILTNMGLIYATLGEHEAAVEHFRQATKLDPFLAVAYFQCGVSNFLLARYKLAHTDFEAAYGLFRENQPINYEQIGLKFRLFPAEVLFNMGLSSIYMGDPDTGKADMERARKEKAIADHDVIDDAITDGGEGYTVFSIPVGVLYRPSEKKLKNAAQRDYMGRAKLVAASDPGDAYVEFTGITRLKKGISPANVFVERPPTDDALPNLSRSATAPNPTPPKPSETVNLGRSKTTLNVPANARELIAPSGRSGSPSQPAPEPSISRSNTQITPARASPNASVGGPTRGLSARRPDAQISPLPPPQPPKDNRVTDIYDDYINSYNDAPPPPPPNPTDRVATWARNNANPPTRAASRSAPTSTYAPSSYAGASMRRKPTRRGTRREAPSRAQSYYEEDEEGYASGDYDEGPYELVKIRVKLHYQDDVRGMALTPDMPFEEFMDKVTAKFGKAMDGLGLKFKDEDGGKVTLRDESDYDLAIETARAGSQGKSEGKLEVWCSDL